MRNISFSMTTPQFRARTKTVTRRLGWETVKVGDRLMGIEKGQGLKRGEKVVQLGPIIVKSVEREPLSDLVEFYDQSECNAEGFPEYTPEQFVRMFCAANGCKPETMVTRIEFEYVDPPGSSRQAPTVINAGAAWPLPLPKDGRRP